jgi:23S rRNA (cytidine1920-2'-O)/16S rRNA (cytidine1409-2'-O)-methyltransferase
MAKRRLDVLLLERGLVESREKARAVVMAGAVLVDERAAVKPAILVDEGAELRLVEGPKYVSRGGDKLAHALDTFGIDPAGAVAADIGASTGGFTDCLLQRGAARVYAIDVGKGQLDYRLRRDPRVAVMEGVNARYLDPLPEHVDLVVVDVAFISLRQVLPPAMALLRNRGDHLGLGTKARLTDTKARLKPGLQGGREGDGGRGGEIVALFKPQFEAERREVGKGGVIRDPLLHATLIGRFAAWCVGAGLRVRGLTASPLLGASGNREFFFRLAPVEITA